MQGRYLHPGWLKAQRDEGYAGALQVLKARGQRVTPEMADAFARQGITTVRIADNAPVLEPVMRPATRTPLLNPDWMARLGHRYLRESLLAGAHRGDISNIHGTHPVPAYAHGAEFGQGEEGKY